MRGFSPVDGFLQVKEEVDEMIKSLANEPSVGLFFVQQHARSSMPHLLDIKDKLVEKIHEVTLHTEDIEDSVRVMRSMTECGVSIADDMIKDINKSLLIMSTIQPKKGLVGSPSWGFGKTGRNSAAAASSSKNDGGSPQQDARSNLGYLSAVLNSAKEKATGFRWTQPNPLPGTITGSSPCPVPVSRREDSAPYLDELPLSSSPMDEMASVEQDTTVSGESGYGMSYILEYNKMKSDYDARLEQWLQEPENL